MKKIFFIPISIQFLFVPRIPQNCTSKWFPKKKNKIFDTLNWQILNKYPQHCSWIHPAPKWVSCSQPAKFSKLWIWPKNNPNLRAHNGKAVHVSGLGSNPIVLAQQFWRCPDKVWWCKNIIYNFFFYINNDAIFFLKIFIWNKFHQIKLFFFVLRLLILYRLI